MTRKGYTFREDEDLNYTIYKKKGVRSVYGKSKILMISKVDFFVENVVPQNIATRHFRLTRMQCEVRTKHIIYK
jgi:hypothetical protein